MGESMYDYQTSPKLYAQKLALHIGCAVVVGIIINDLSKYIQKKYKINPKVMIAVQLLFIITFLYIVETKISRNFAIEWQSTTPGFVFVAIIFSIQYNLFTNFQELTFV